MSLDHYIARWALHDPVGLATTQTSRLYRVVQSDRTAVLKIFSDKGRRLEARGARVLEHFDGHGAVRLLAHDEGAQLLELVDGPMLASVVTRGEDEVACAILCDVVEELHSATAPIPSELLSMRQNFASLFEAAHAMPIITRGARVAEELLATERDVRVLHGDLHHENVLHSSQRGWLAIDPQCVAGERAYDVANVLYNPTSYFVEAKKPEVIERRVATFCRRLGLERSRVLAYAFAYGCLSATWCLEERSSPDETLAIASSIHALLAT